jgi:hypothetical protein
MVNRLAGPWLMELDDDSLAVSPAEVEGEVWDRLVARLAVPAEASPASGPRQPPSTLCRRQVVADIERLVAQLVAEVDRLLERFDPALAPTARDSGSWTKAQRASLLAHASGALVERTDAPAPERA